MTTSNGRSMYPWVILGLLTAFWGLVGLNRVGIGFVLPAIRDEFGLAFWQAGLLVSGTSFTWAITSWLSGWLSDHYGRRRVLLPGAFLAVGATAAMGGTWNFWSLFVVREFVGIGDGVGWPNSQAVLAAEFPAKRRAFVQSVFTMGYPLFGSVLGAIVITQMAEALGWRPAFAIIGGVFFFVVLALYFVMREPPRAAVATRARSKPDWRKLVGVVRYPSVVVLMIIQAAALGWLQVGVAYNTLFLTDDVGVSLVTAGTILSIFGIAGVAGTLLLPYCSDFTGRKPAIFFGGVLSGVFMVLFVVGDVGVAAAATFLALSSFFNGLIIPLAAATVVSELLPEDEQGSAMGSINFAGVIVGTFLMPILGGVLADNFGLRAAILLAAGLITVSGVAALFLPETAPRVRARHEAQLAAREAAGS